MRRSRWGTASRRLLRAPDDLCSAASCSRVLCRPLSRFLVSAAPAAAQSLMRGRLRVVCVLMLSVR